MGQKKYIDHHAHVWGTGYKELHPKLDNARSIEEVLDILRPSLKGLEQELRDLQLLTPNPEPQTPFLTARGWDQNKWQQHHFPTRDDLDALSTEIPIALTRIDGHAMWCNSKALEAAHITRSTTAPSGGDIVKTTSGSPTGILLDDAMQLIFDVLPVESDASVIKTLRTGLDTFAKHHYEVHDMGIPAEWWQPYKTLYSDHGDALIKAKVFLDMSKPSGKSLFLQKMNEDVFNDSPHPNLELVGIKLYLDGALGSRGAQLFKPYADDPTNSGLSLISDDEAFHLMSLASDRGLTIAIHAIGDKANHRALNLFERLNISQPGTHNGNPQFRIEHAQIVREDDLPRFHSIGVAAVIQPQFFASDRHWAIDRLGTDRMRDAYRWRSLLDSGAIVLASSDSPVEEANANIGVELLQTRDGVNDGEAITKEEAEKIYAVME